VSWVREALDIPSISAIVAATSVAVGVLYYSFQIRHQTKIRQTDLVMKLYSTYGSKEFQDALWKTMAREYKDYNDYEQKYGWPEVVEVGTFFEGIGLLLKRKLIDIQLVDDLFTGPVRLAWEKMKLMIEGARKHLNMPTAYEWFEYLYNEMQKRTQQLAKTQ